MDRHDVDHGEAQRGGGGGACRLMAEGIEGYVVDHSEGVMGVIGVVRGTDGTVIGSLSPKACLQQKQRKGYRDKTAGWDTIRAGLTREAHQSMVR